MSQDPELRAHHEWLGYLQPVGLVVSPSALRDAQAFVNKNIVQEQSILIRHALDQSARESKRGEAAEPRLNDFPAFAFDFWGWEPTDLAGGPGGPELPSSLEVPLPEYGEVLVPRYAVPDPENDGSWLLLIDVVPDGSSFDEAPDENQHDKRWNASPQARFERLLRANQIPAGLLVNPESIRIVYAPRGESTGYLTFPLKAMCEVAGRPIVAALHLLLEAGRLFTLPTNQRLPWILQQSRKYQNEVSTTLAGQVLRALNELLRGFQAANDATSGALLRDVLKESPQEIYGGLLTSLLRMVFILYAEDRGLLSNDPVYVGSYSLSGLFERLREDDAQYPDTMEQRFGAWTQFLTLCRLIYDGGGHGILQLPPRHGRLFDPDAYPFLEGRPPRSKREDHPTVTPPRVADGVMFRVLQDLLMLDGERLSYRSLDVEQIGSVYEAMMGFEVQVAKGASIGIGKYHVVLDLAELAATPAADRVKALREQAKCALTGKTLEQFKKARSADEVAAALARRISPLYLDDRSLPLSVAPGGMYLQPTEARRRSGSHYTPRSLTEPIVRTTLEPVLKQLGDKPTPQQILSLKVCDPAMGSGAFLVEVCRYLAEALVEAWSVHNETPIIPPDQEPVLHARRMIAQRCLYGVDRNPFAVDLAKLSLWLATLAKDHPFTFLDHSLRCGDSLVGLTPDQIEAMHWATKPEGALLRDLPSRLRRLLTARAQILGSADNTPYETLVQKLAVIDEQMTDLRLAGNLTIAAFFAASKPRPRELKRKELAEKFRRLQQKAVDLDLEDELRQVAEQLSAGPKGIEPFHWQLEFPEVFEAGGRAAEGGFDAIVGNPPFAGKNTLTAGAADGYLDWLKALHPESHGNSDVVAHFFRRAFTLLKPMGRFGLIATNTIGQGDTRSTGLRWICKNGGTIYQARKRMKWPGLAAVVVSVVHVARGHLVGPFLLDGREVQIITAYLFHSGGHDDPERLVTNEGMSFQGSIVLGMGFTFDDTDKDGVASTLAEMERLTEKDPRNRNRIFPYIGGDEVNNSPTHKHHRFVINFEDFPLRRKERGHSWFQLSEETQREQLREGIVAPDYPDPVAEDWPDLLAIVEAKVRPERRLQKRQSNRERYWHYAEKRPGLTRALRRMPFVLAQNCGAAPHLALCFLDSHQVFANTLALITFDTHETFGLLQSRTHEVWARFMASSMKDDLRYTPSDCFETFPFPHEFESNANLEAIGRTYYEFRAAFMQRENIGLTATYNHFHDPDCTIPDILELRRLHDQMDRAVLDAYNWGHIRLQCEFIPEFDDEEEEDEKGRSRKKKFRYRWPDEIRDEVLALLLDLNRQRAEEERLAGLRADAAPAPTSAAGRSSRNAPSMPTLDFGEEDSE